MRIFGRIVFALLATFTFWFAVDYAQGAMANRYFSNEGNTAIEEGDDVFFYGASRDFHQRGAIYTHSANGYTLSIYEVAEAKVISGSLEVTSFAYIMLRSEIKMTGNYDLSFFSGEERLDLVLHPFRSLNLRVVLNPEKTVFGVDTDILFEKEYSEITLYDAEGGIIFRQDILLEESDFILEDKLEGYYETQGKLPFTELSDEQLYPAISHDLKDYMHILWISMAVYFVVLGLAIYIVFFLRRKYLGKTKPSEYLVKDRHKYQNSDS